MSKLYFDSTLSQLTSRRIEDERAPLHSLVSVLFTNCFQLLDLGWRLDPCAGELEDWSASSPHCVRQAARDNGHGDHHFIARAS